MPQPLRYYVAAAAEDARRRGAVSATSSAERNAPSAAAVVSPSAVPQAGEHGECGFLVYVTCRSHQHYARCSHGCTCSNQYFSTTTPSIIHNGSRCIFSRSAAGRRRRSVWVPSVLHLSFPRAVRMQLLQGHVQQPIRTAREAPQQCCLPHTVSVRPHAHHHNLDPRRVTCCSPRTSWQFKFPEASACRQA